MHSFLAMFMMGLQLVAGLPHLQTGGESMKAENNKSVHHHMTKQEIEHYFGVSGYDKVPEYEVVAPYQTDEEGRILSLSRHSSRRRRNSGHPEMLFYSLHAFGKKLTLRLRRNDKLMAPNLVIESHDEKGRVTTQHAPKNKYYLGQVTTDPGSTVALRSNKGLTGMVRTSRDTFFVQPLAAHLAKGLGTSLNAAPHLVYKKSAQEEREFVCQVKAARKRLKRSLKTRKTREIGGGFKYLEAALVVPTSYRDKYGNKNFATVLLVIANMVAGMYQDPSMGQTKIYYVVTKIIVVNTSEVGFPTNASSTAKLKTLLRWAARFIAKPDNDPDHFDVFSYISNNIPVGGLASSNTMCRIRASNGNLNSDVGLQTALYVAHETGHNFGVHHDTTDDCPSMKYIMSGILPTGVYAATWSNCSRPIIENFIESSRSWCLNDSPFETGPTLPPQDSNKLPGELFDGDDQCEYQYGFGWRLSPYSPGVCRALYCEKNGVVLSRFAPVADGAKCGIRHWCMGGRCVDNGLPKRHGGWSNWGSVYSTCTRTCGGGVQYRIRTCTNPVPSNGGEQCRGTTQDWRICKSQECPKTKPTFREQQCVKVNNVSTPYYRKADPCRLMCRVGWVASLNGAVKDGTRCSLNDQTLDVCIQGTCRSVGCDHVLESGKRVDRCGKCGNDGDECIGVKSNYTDSPTTPGPDHAGLVSRIPAGSNDALFQMRKVSYNYLGLQSDNGTYIVGGHLRRGIQTVTAAGVLIVYTHKRARFKDKLEILGRTNEDLRVVYVFIRGKNPGLDYSFMRPIAPGEEPPNNKKKWRSGYWSACSTSCGEGVQSRVVRCVRSDDGSPASDAACRSRKPGTTKACSVADCPSEWHVTHWSICSKSCGNGGQTRQVICRKKVNLFDYGPSSNCSADTKPSIADSFQPCNVIACPADWDTQEGFSNDKCGEPIDPDRLKCYRVEETGERTRVPDIFCRSKIKPTVLPCTTQSTSKSRTTTTTTTKTTTRRSTRRALASRETQSLYSLVMAFSLLSFQI